MEREKLIALVSAAQAGDADALSRLFDAFYQDIYYFALKTTKDPDRACDVTQETFVTVMTHIQQLQEPAAFVSWAKQIAYRECLRHVAPAREILADTDEDDLSIFDITAEDRTEFIPEEALDQQEFRKTILDMLDTLSAQQRAAVLLYYYDEMSVKQIAQIQGVSEGTVKSRLNYARKAIKASVEHYEKKHGVRLHSVALLPLLYWLFAATREPMSAAGRKAVTGAVEAAISATGTAAAGGAATAAGTAAAGGAATAAGTAAAGGAATAAGTAAAGSAATAAVGISLTAKVIAAVTAAAVITATGITAIVLPNREPKPSEPSVDAGPAIIAPADEPEEPVIPQESTEEPTEETTEEPTEETTEEPTEEVTEEATEAPTEETTEETTEAPTESLQQGEQIPAGCRYVTADGVTLEAGAYMPVEPASGDAFITPDYTYKYQHYISYDTWQSDSGACWGVAVNDKGQSSYGTLRSYICDRPVVWLSYTFYGCSNLTAAPAIPDTVTGLYFTFAGCSSLVSAPAIHGNISTMSNTFSDCVSLTTAPTIPANVSFMTFTFSGCTSLTGQVVIHAEPANFQYCFSGTVNPIILTGSSSYLDEMAATAENGNVTVG